MLVAVLFAVAFVSVQCTLLGGYQPVDVSDEDVQKYADFAVGRLNSEMNNYFYMKKTEVSEASYQMVSGKNYYLTIELSPTVCKKSDNSVEDMESCELQGNWQEKTLICKVVVWVQTWLEKVTMTKHNCSLKSN